LIDIGKKLLQDKKNTKLLSHTKGLSHGISGISLGLYRLAEYLACDEALDLSRQLELRESELVLQDGWTQNQRNGAPLVAWCHGSAGISLALSCMPKLLKTEKRLKDYFDRSVLNTINSKFYNSHCLCHGAFGNQVILEAIDQPIGKLDCDIEAARKALITSGFASFGAAQTLSIGLMTGLSGLGLYFLSKSSQNSKKFDFLSLK
jgi:lantibiotic modifying enzyme